MNCPAFTLNTTFALSWTVGKHTALIKVG